MVDLSRLMQDAAILDVIDKSADEASSLSAQNSYQAMRIEDLERELSAAKADQAAVRRHAEKMATTLDHWASIDACNCAALDAYRRDYPKEPT